MPTTSVLLGSHPAVPATTITVTANAVTTGLNFAGGPYYLYHPTGSLSLLTAVVALINTHSELLGTGAVLARSGLVRLTNAVAFSIDSWGSDTTLRDLLGFTGALTSATAHVATEHSPLYWSPGKTESSSARMGSDGILVKDTYAARSAPGQIVSTTNNQWRENLFAWGYVHIDRIERVPDESGTWAYWWDYVASRSRRFWLARNVIEDSADDSTAMSLSTKLPTTGAYVMAHDGAMRREHNREIERLELYSRVELPVETALEYGA